MVKDVDKEDESVLLSYGEVSTITINRSKSLNALNLDVLKSLFAIIEKLEEKSEVKLVILQGSGEKAFVAGADIKAMYESDKSGLEEFINLGQSVMNKIENSNKIFISKVDGYALGGGFELALASDIIVASEKASFALPEVGLGLIPGFGGTQRLQRRSGIGYAKFLSISAERIDAKTAFSKGIVDVLFEHENFDVEFQKLLLKIVAKGSNAQVSAKKSINNYNREVFEKGLKFEIKSFIKLAKEPEALEGMQAFLENRKPKFKE
ncbi:UNVERIFIED_CONTAM: hypothetical protein GTU68_028886 [Idotea baltica]|nr:hypothetical protein [Idotea baltica]